MRLSLLTLCMVLIASVSWAQGSTWPSTRVTMSSTNTLQEDVDDGTMRSAIRTVVSALPGSPTNLSQTYIVTDGDALDDCSTGGASPGVLVHCSWDGSAWQSLGGGGGGGAPTDADYWVGTADPGLSAEIVVDDLAALNTALGSSVADGAHTTVSADHIDAIDEIAAALKSGSDAVVVTGTAGSTGECAEWDANGDLVTAGAACGTAGGTDSKIVWSKDVGVTESETYTYNPIPDDGTIHRQTRLAMVPTSSGNIDLGGPDFPWLYTIGCGPSGPFWVDDCTDGYAFNLPSNSSFGRVNPYLPGLQHNREYSYVGGGTSGELWHEQNQTYIYPFTDIDLGDPAASGHYTPGYWILIDPDTTWDTGDEAWAKIVYTDVVITVSSPVGTFSVGKFIKIEPNGGGAIHGRGEITAVNVNDLTIRLRTLGAPAGPDHTALTVGDDITEVDDLYSYATTGSDATADYASIDGTGEVRVSWGGVRADGEPATSDVVNEVDSMLTRTATGVSGTYPSDPTHNVNEALRFRAAERGNDGSPWFDKWIVPRDIADTSETKTVLSAGVGVPTGHGGNATYASLNSDSNNPGVNVGGPLNLYADPTAETASFHDRGGIRFYKGGSPGAILHASDNSQGTFYMPRNTAGAPALAPAGFDEFTMTPIVAFSWTGASGTGDWACNRWENNSTCEWVIKLSEGDPVATAAIDGTWYDCQEQFPTWGTLFVAICYVEPIP